MDLINLFLCKGDMAQVGLKRQLAPGLHISSVLGISELGETETIERTCKALALLAAAIFTFSKRCHKRSFDSISSQFWQFWFADQIQIRFRLPAANVQPPRFALRVCEKCVIAPGFGHVGMSSALGWDGVLQVSRSAGNGYNPKGVLQQTAKMAAEVSWRSTVSNKGITWKYHELP